MANNTSAVRSYKLPALDYENLSRSEQKAVVEITLEMNRVRAAVAGGRFENLTTVDAAIDFLREKAARLGSELPESFVTEVRASAVRESLRRAEDHPRVLQQAGRLLDEARQGLAASDQSRYRFFAGKARAYFEEHRLPTGELDRLDEAAVRNPFFTYGDISETPRPRAAKTVNPFE